MDLASLHTVYFIGIGGIGMSALARYFNSRGVKVYGYDRTSTNLTTKLSKEGCSIHFDERVDVLPSDIDLVIYTPAIPASHKELVWLKENGFPVHKRSEVLGWISKQQRGIGIAGTHGKTTTTSILTHLLREGGVDCSAFLGGISLNYNSNYVDGKSDWVVIEADEFDRSFLQLEPEICGLTSMDADHLDIYGDASAMEKTYTDFLKQVKPGGKVIVNSKLKGIELPKEINMITYGLDEGDYCAKNLGVKNGFFTFDLYHPKGIFSDVHFSLPGAHNVENATLATTIALHLGVGEKKLREALMSFKGIRRRFEQVFSDGDKVFIDDYAHHPEELKAAIGAAKMLYPDKKITGVFQPHLYSRTLDFAKEFAASLEALDEIILLDIYPAREEPIEGVSSEIIFNYIQNPAKVLIAKTNLLDLLKRKSLQVLMTLGAGNIDKLVDPIKAMLSAKIN